MHPGDPSDEDGPSSRVALPQKRTRGFGSDEDTAEVEPAEGDAPHG